MSSLKLLSKMDTTKYGPLFIGSPLSFHLSALEFNFTVVSNLEPAVNLAKAYPSDICKVNLPYQFPDLPEAVHFNTAQENFIEHLREWRLSVTLAFSSPVMLDSMSTSTPK